MIMEFFLFRCRVDLLAGSVLDDVKDGLSRVIEHFICDHSPYHFVLGRCDEFASGIRLDIGAHQATCHLLAIDLHISLHASWHHRLFTCRTVLAFILCEV